MRFRGCFVLGLLLLHPGCAFFGVERTDCLPDADCSVTVGDGDGDGDGAGAGDGDGELGGDGDGDLSSSGGSGDGDGDGDGSGGYGDGDGDMAGSTSTGGEGGSGGGGTGGAGTGGGGTGGAGTGGGGTGGDGTGGDGTGGMPSGGSGGMGTGGAAQADPVLSINEIHTQYVEIYLQGAGTFNLDDYRIVVDGVTANACELTGGVVDSSDPFFVAYRGSSSCSSCVVNCPFDSIGTSTEVRLERFVDGDYQPVSTAFSLSIELSGTDSYQAVPDGDDEFITRSPTSPGDSNN